MTKRNVLPTPNVDAISACSPLFRKFIAGFVFDGSLASASRLTINVNFEVSRIHETWKPSLPSPNRLKRFERSEAIERFERLERVSVLYERSD